MRLTEAVQAMAAARRAHRAGNYARSYSLLRLARDLLGGATRGPMRPAAWLNAWLQLLLGHHEYARGAFSRAARLYARAATAFRTDGDILGESTAVRGLGNVNKYLGLYAQAAEHYDRAIELARACRDAVGAAAAGHNHGNVFLALGDLPKAAAAYRRAITAFRNAGRDDLVRHASMSLASVEQRRGRTREALRLLHLAAPPASTGHLHAGDEAERLVAVAEAESALGRTQTALATLERAVALAHAAGETHTEALAHRTTATLLLEIRADSTEALAAARRGIRATATARSPTEITAELHELAARASEQCGEWREAARHFQRAFATQRRFATQRNREYAESVALHRELAQARHQAELARLENTRLSEALAQIAARLESEQTRLPSAAPADEISPDSLRGLGLRPREAEVLLWVIHGKSNVEIATILGCSAETVKSHLKRIYAQLDVTNRTAAAASALARTSS